MALQMPEIPEATIQLHCESKYIIKRVQIFCKMVKTLFHLAKLSCLMQRHNINK